MEKIPLEEWKNYDYPKQKFSSQFYISLHIIAFCLIFFLLARYIWSRQLVYSIIFISDLDWKLISPIKYAEETTHEILRFLIEICFCNFAFDWVHGFREILGLSWTQTTRKTKRNSETPLLPPRDNPKNYTNRFFDKIAKKHNKL